MCTPSRWALSSHSQNRSTRPPQKAATHIVNAFVLVSLSRSTRRLNSAVDACAPMAFATARAASTYALSASPSCADSAALRLPETVEALLLSASDGRTFGRPGVAALIERGHVGVHLVDGVLAGGRQRVTRGANRLGRQRLLALRLPDARRRRRSRHRRGHRRAVGRCDVGVGHGRTVGDSGTSDDPHQQQRDAAERQGASPGELPPVPARHGAPSDEHGM